MINLIIELWQRFYYGLLGRTSTIDLSVLPAEISLKTHYDSKNNVYWVECKELPDFEATGKTLESLAEHIGDALLVYADIPRYFARRYQDGILTIKDPKSSNEQIVRVSRKGVERVFA